MKPWLIYLLICVAITHQLPLAKAVDAPVTTSELTMVDIEREQALVALKKERTSLMLARFMPFVGMGFTILILTIIFRFIRRADETRHETIRQYLEKGEPVPRQLLVDSGDPATWEPVSDRRKGILWCAIGLGTSATLLILSSGSIKAGAVGIIPLFIGVGYFIAALIDPKATDGQD